MIIEVYIQTSPLVQLVIGASVLPARLEAT